MSEENLVVYIDPQQLKAQKNNKFSLYLAKMVNGKFTVIWQSKGPVATVGTPSYEYKNTFTLSIPSFKVNYTTQQKFSGGDTFESGGQDCSIELGNQVTLDQYGIFSAPVPSSDLTSIQINNELQGNPHEILKDAGGNPLYVNTQSGMDTGTATLTPKDTYQVWFDNYQNTGTIISENRSKVKTVILGGGTSATITYNKQGDWVDGGLPEIS